jgi:hypothetical protein
VSYEFGPRDLDEPRGERDIRDPDDALEAAFERWQAERGTIAHREIGGSISRELYDLAVDSLDDFSVRAVDAAGLLLAHRNSLTPAVGLFLSAAYNLAPASVAVFDVAVPTPPKHLGYRLRADKTLVLNAPAHSTMAVGAEGLVVNRTDVTTYFGYSPEAAFINLGSCLVFGTDDASVAANLGTVRGNAASETPILTVGGDRRHRLDADDVDASPDLRAYLDDLRDGLAGDRRALEAFVCNLEPSPRRAIKRELRARLAER